MHFQGEIVHFFLKNEAMRSENVKLIHHESWSVTRILSVYKYGLIFLFGCHLQYFMFHNFVLSLCGFIFFVIIDYKNTNITI